jgi:hypothetical protein
MPKKYVVEFLARWIRDEEFRCKVLHREITTLQDWELTGEQVDDLTSLDKQKILNRILKEFETDLGVDLDKVQQEVIGVPAPPILGPTAAAMGTVYTEGAVHVRGIQPKTVPVGVEKVLVLRGQGFEGTPQVTFERGTTSVTPTVVSVSCDVDVYQRVTMKVTLNEVGEWTVRARNVSTDPWSAEFATVQVV